MCEEIAKCRSRVPLWYTFEWALIRVLHNLGRCIFELGVYSNGALISKARIIQAGVELPDLDECFVHLSYMRSDEDENP